MFYKTDLFSFILQISSKSDKKKQKMNIYSIFLLLVNIAKADMASFNRYGNNIINHGRGQSRAAADPLIEYKLKLAQALISRSSDAATLKKLTAMLSGYKSDFMTTRHERRTNGYLKGHRNLK